MFLHNERELEVKNGTLGTIEEVTPQRMNVRADDERSRTFDLKDDAHIDHGYAATIHKAQGMTVDRPHVLATPGMDSRWAYVVLSRLRDSVALHYGHNDFADQGRLVRALSHERSKDMASDYARADPVEAFAERRGITFRERVAEIISKVPEKVRGIFDGLRLPSARADVPETAVPERKVVEDPEVDLLRARTKTLIRHARAVDDIFAAHDAGGNGRPDQLRELHDVRKASGKLRPHGPADAEAAYSKAPGLAREAGGGQVRRAVRAFQLETELRTDLQWRADRFVARWQEPKQTGERQYRNADMSGYRGTRSAMGDMARSLERDPQLEPILANRKRELGIGYGTGRRLGAELAFTHGIDRGRGRGIGI